MEEETPIVSHGSGAYTDIEQPLQITIKSNSGVSRFTEPATHRLNKSTWEWLFGSCMHRTNDLTSNEIEEFGELYQDCLILFDNTNPSHMLALSELWTLLTSEQMEKDNFKSEKWISFGFQNRNPTTDFRGGGLTSLLQIISFVNNNKDLVLNEMCSPDNDFFFAIASINVTFYLKQTLHCAEYLDPNKDKKIFCNRQSFKTFCGMLVKDPQVFNRLHDIVLIDMFNSWIEMKKSDPSTSLLDFPKVEDRFKEKFKKVLASAEFNTFQEFSVAFTKC